MAISARHGLGAVFLLLGLCQPALAVPPDEKHHCPEATPANSFMFAASGNESDGEKGRLATIAGAIVKNKQPVCLLALVDPKNGGYAKKLAIRRVIWVRDNLLHNGVPPGLIAAELRPAAPDQDKATLSGVTVILGK